MSDRIYMALAFIGFVIIAIVCIINYDGSQELKEFGPGTYYTPQARAGMTSSSSIYDQMTNKRSIACPVTQLVPSAESPVSLNGVAGSRHPYQISYLFVTWESLKKSRTTLSQRTFYKSVGWDDGRATGSNPVTFGTLCPDAFSGIYPYCEIIAPFGFKFENLNTDTENGRDIVIVNSGGSKRGKCRITFENVANWFCADIPGTTQTVSNGKRNNEAEWEDHWKYHQTIIGNSKNAEINGGRAGIVLGYASAETTIKIEVYDGSWREISISEWLEAK